MPAAAENGDIDREKDRDGKGKSSSSKSKDLSHVPCKFFRVGSCTAGGSCPFSHSAPEPGAHKDVCTWFVKGNCKFAHKCALAHILPGQSMAMDRKNKKAAQVAAGGSAAKEHGKSGRGGGAGKRDAQGLSSRNPLLSGGSAAPSRMNASSGRPPMALKASISPSAPAPALRDTDFASFAALDESSKLPSAPAHRKIAKDSTDPTAHDSEESNTPEATPASTLPVSSPRRTDHSPNNKPLDFGPIGSPPRSTPSATSPGSLTRHMQAAGFSGSPGTSPAVNGVNPGGTNFLSTSPFSAPGTQSVFLSGPGRMGPSSLGTNFVMGGALKNQLANEEIAFDYEDYDAQNGARGIRRGGNNSAVEDDEMEDFLPSSLTDLLTPEERQRRMSRSNSGQGSGAVTARLDGERKALGVQNLIGGTGSSPGHRYSRSVPAQSLLADMGSIWTDPHSNIPVSSGLPASPSRLGLGGTPGSYKSAAASAFGGRSFDPLADDSMVSPSNASAAFLPGLHHHYSNRQGALPTMANRGLRNTSNPLFSSGHPSGLTAGAPTFHPSTTAAGLSSQLSNYAAGPRTSALEHTQFSNAATGAGSRAIPNHQQPQHDDPHILSPSSRALQSHAPGQSLPQGVGAGLSRLHAMPPLPMISPGSTIGGFSVSPGINSVFANGPYGTNNTDWNTLPATPTPTAPALPPGLGVRANAGSYSQTPGLDAMMAKMSYSNVASRANAGQQAQVPRASNPPAGPGAGPGAGGRQQAAGHDDDTLFDFD